MEVFEARDDVVGPGARDRLARAAAPRNFNAGLAHADWREYTHVMKLDGDIELPPKYLRTLAERFGADRRLGLAGACSTSRCRTDRRAGSSFPATTSTAR
jgi:hypothetical protein